MDTPRAVNEIVASGRIITIKERKNGDKIVTLITKNGRDVFLRFVCSKGVLPELNDHAHVQITGHVISVAYRDDNKKFHQDQSFVADEIIPSPTLTEKKFGVKGKFFAYPECAAYLKGTVKKVLDEGEWVRLILHIDEERKDRKPATVRLSMKKLSRQPELKKGDTICAVCTVTTPKKMIDGKATYFEDLLISDLAKVE